MSSDPQDTYLTLSAAQVAEGYYTEKRSKFYAFAHHAETADEVKVLRLKYQKEYHDARHICYAYRLGSDGGECRANDDGEPSGTAGKPILGALSSQGLTDAVVFVVRYYGGVNLGTGGLVVAYREAALDALAKADREERLVEESVTHTFAYKQMNTVMRAVKDTGARIVKQELGEDCTMTLAVRKSQAEELKGKLAAR